MLFRDYRLVRVDQSNKKTSLAYPETFRLSLAREG